MLKKITSTDDHKAALAIISKAMENLPAMDSPEGIELAALVDEVERYEEEHFPIPMPDLNSPEGIKLLVLIEHYKEEQSSTPPP